MILVLFSSSYPYGTATDQTFLKEEIQYLATTFEKVVLVPRKCEGQRLPVPHNVIVADGYSSFLKNPLKPYLVLKIFTSNIFYRDLATRPSIIYKPQLLFRLIVFLAGAYLTETWVTRWMEEQHLHIRDCIFYTYWFDQAAMGIGMIKRTCPDIKLVSRAHGYDIYEELYFPFYWPCRLQALSTLDKLFPASEDGVSYFKEKYPQFAPIVESALLGVKDPGFQTNQSTDRVFRIVSCAQIVPLKRIDLLLEGIACAARMRPEQKFEWLHFGGGKSRDALIRMAKEKFPHNAIGNLPGNVPNREILKHYTEKPVDVFVNLSTTEGIAVSIMEAISCGIPVIATSVGGSPEIVSERNGLLLPINPSPEEVAQALLHLCDNPEIRYSMRKESRKVWHESYNADINFRLFAERLKSIRED